MKPNNKKIRNITSQLIDGVKRLNKSHIRGIYLTLINSYKLPDNQNTVNQMKEVVFDYFFGNFEPEYVTEEDYNFWEYLTPEILKGE